MRADVLFLIRSAQRRRECDLKGVGDEGYLFVAGDKLCQERRFNLYVVLISFFGDGTVIDVGGQDTKAISMRGGYVVKFVMNDNTLLFGKI